MQEQVRAHLEAKRYPEAFDLLVSLYRNKVFRLARPMLGDRALAEEAAQDIFLRVWKSLASYRGEAALGTWIYSIARNTCLSAIRGGAARQAVSLEDPGIQAAVEARAMSWQPRGSGPDFAALIGELPDKQRQVLTLYYMEDKSYKEVARLLDLPMGTVKTSLHRARKQLAIALAAGTIKQGGR